VPADDGVIEYLMPADREGDARSRVYVQSGELLRTKDVNVADLVHAAERSSGG